MAVSGSHSAALALTAGDRSCKDGTEMPQIGVVDQTTEAPDASLILNTDEGLAWREHRDWAGRPTRTENVNGDAARELKMRRSICYILSFIASGLMVGTCGPALPTLLKRFAEE
eukprot:3935608-Rhodomonas_salina.1